MRVPVTDAEGAAVLMARAAEARACEATAMNAVSSRSHCVFMLYIAASHAATNTNLTGSLCLVDLAGRWVWLLFLKALACPCCGSLGAVQFIMPLATLFLCLNRPCCVHACHFIQVLRVISTETVVSHVGNTNAHHQSSTQPQGDRPSPDQCHCVVCVACSERLDRSMVEDMRKREACSINQSLSALGDVFAALSSKTSHIPYRNSKLTYLLQVRACLIDLSIAVRTAAADCPFSSSSTACVSGLGRAQCSNGRHNACRKGVVSSNCVVGKASSMCSTVIVSCYTPVSLLTAVVPLCCCAAAVPRWPRQDPDVCAHQPRASFSAGGCSRFGCSNNDSRHNLLSWQL
jgi:hypothetical protein